MENKIVVDFDDTICLHSTLIEKLNKAYDKGYKIHITSTSDEKFRQQIEDDLKKNKCKYDSLTFLEPGVLIYIDAKSMRPEDTKILDFLETFH